MSSAPRVSEDLQSAVDQQLTRERSEIKYAVRSEHIRRLVAAFDERMAPHRFRGEGANPLPYAQHFITTVYLDTSSRAHYQAAQANVERNVKVRMREYYDVHPSLAELATSPEELLHKQPWIWLEVKRRAGAVTTKRRARLPKRDIPQLFSGEGTALAGHGATQGEGEEALNDIAEYCRSLGEALRPDCLANYERLSWQDSAAGLRVTLDLDVTFFAPVADLWRNDRVLSREILGDARGRSAASGVLELKHQGSSPPWLQELLAGMNLSPTRHSKFVLASEAVHSA